MVKSYLRYCPSSTLGVIASANSNIICASPTTASKSVRVQPTLAIVPALESIKIWNVRTSGLLAALYDSPSTAEVTALAQNPAHNDFVAAGYQDGTIRLWKLNENWTDGELVVTFNGHKSAITELCFDKQGNRLASGSKDTDVVLWDIVSEEGIARLRSHQDQITGLSFLNPKNDADEETRTVGDYLLTAGKDGLIKVWDLTTNFCIETHLSHRGESWALAVSPAQDVVVTAGPDGELKFWTATLPAKSDMDVDDIKILAQRGVISRANRDRPLSLKFHPSAEYLVVHASNRNIEIFRIRSAEEVKRLLVRKRKRKSSKKGSTDGEDTSEIDENSIKNDIMAYTTIRASAKVRSVDWDSTVSSTSVHVKFPRYLD
jgi:U3 small nucleolar RNA-associated protein 12